MALSSVSFHCRKKPGVGNGSAARTYVFVEKMTNHTPPRVRGSSGLSRGVAGSDRRLSRSLATRVKGNSLKGAGKAEGSCLA